MQNDRIRMRNGEDGDWSLDNVTDFRSGSEAFAHLEGRTTILPFPTEGLRAGSLPNPQKLPVWNPATNAI